MVQWRYGNSPSTCTLGSGTILAFDVYDCLDVSRVMSFD